MQLQKPNTETTVLASFVVLKLFLHCFLINSVYELHRDEFLHLDQANHLAWGFQSIPPLTSIFALIIKTLGGSVFVIRLFTACIGGGTLIYAWLIVKELKGDLYAKTLCMVALLACAIARLDLLFQPNAFDILCWTATFYYLIRYISTNKPSFIYCALIAIAIGFLNKYSIAFLVIGLTLGFSLSPQRYIFTIKHLYYAAVLGLLLVLPNLLWQYENHFPVIKHMKELTVTQLDKINRIDFLKDQLLYYIGDLWILFAAAFAFFIYKPLKDFRWIGLSYLITIAFFTWFKAKGYYAAGLYPVLLACGSVYLAALLKNGWKRYLKVVPLITAVGMFFLVLPFAYPILTPQQITRKKKKFEKVGALRWEDGKNHHLPQDFADMLGWKELANIVDEVYKTIPEKEKVIILCDNYGEAGAINHYSSFKNINAVSFNADYMTWINLDEQIKTVILVNSIDDDDPERKVEKPIFERVTKINTVKNKMAREYGTSVYLLENPKIDINARLRAELKDHQN